MALKTKFFASYAHSPESQIWEDALYLTDVSSQFSLLNFFFLEQYLLVMFSDY